MYVYIHTYVEIYPYKYTYHSSGSDSSITSDRARAREHDPLQRAAAAFGSVKVHPESSLKYCTNQLKYCTNQQQQTTTLQQVCRVGEYTYDSKGRMHQNFGHPAHTSV